MTTLKTCITLAGKVKTSDNERLIDALDGYIAAGVPPERAQLMAANDVLAEIQADLKEAGRELRAQHADLFDGSAPAKKVRDAPERGEPVFTPKSGWTEELFRGSPPSPREDMVRSRMGDYMAQRNKSLAKVNPRSVLERDIATAAEAIGYVSDEIAAGRYAQTEVPVGPMPHVLHMLGAPMQMMQINASILRKVLFDKHSDDFAEVTPQEFVRAMYQPAIVSQARSADEFELTTDLKNARGVPITFVLKINTMTLPRPGGVGAKVASVMSAYARPVSTGNDSLLVRLVTGKVRYAEMEKAHAAVINQWAQFHLSLAKGLSTGSIKDDRALVKFIGDNYKAASSPAGWEDAPPFSRREDFDLMADPGGPPQTETRAFRAWFGASKVADAEGKPLVVYHGTPDNITAFRPGTGNFTGSASLASAFASQSPNSGNVVPVYLSIQRPLRVNDPGFWLGSEFLGQLVSKGVLSQQESSDWSDANRKSADPIHDRYNSLLKLVESKGYDGFVYDNTYEGGGDAYKPFRPEQIKSAIGNVGLFDAGNPDIRYSQRDYDAPTTEAIAYIAKMKGLSAGEVTQDYGFADPADYIAVSKIIAEQEAAAVKEEQGRLKTLTPELKRFLRNSTIVDAYGVPKVMYHGTARDITEFRPKQAGAIFLTPNANFADQFTGTSEDWMAANFDKVLEPAQLAEVKRIALAKIKGLAKGDKYWRELLKTAEGGVFEGAALDELQAVARLVMPSMGNIMPLYVRAENPFDYRNSEMVDEMAHMVEQEGGSMPAWLISAIRQGDWGAIESPDVQGAIRSLGHDSFYIVEGGQRNLAVYDPEQVKSAIGNNGNFDPENPDIRYSRRSTLPGKYQLRDFNIGHQFVEAIQDRYNRWLQVTKDIRKQGGVVNEENDFYRAEERYWGMVGSQIEDFGGEVQAFVNAVAKDRILLDDVATYAYAQHAEERNNWIAAQRATMPDGGSGMTTADARDFLQQARLAGIEPELNRHAAVLRSWIQGTRDLLFNEGMIDQAEYDAWTHMFENYVPLRGLEGVTEARGTGQGFNIKGREGKAAMGRKSEARQIIEQVVQDRTRALVRAGKNQVLRSFLQFVMDNPSKNLWEVNAVENKPMTTIDADGNRVISENTQIISDDRTVTLKDGGKEIRILVNDERLLAQLQNLNADHPSRPVAAFLFVNRVLSKLYTALNPVFTVLNAARDIQAATVGVIDELGFMGVPKLYANLPASVWEAYRAEAGTYSADYADYRNTGGKTGFFDFRTLDRQTTELQTMLADAERSPLDPRKFGPKAMHLIEAMNGGVENAVRLAAFKAARQSGTSLAEAAKVSKNITVNFNRRGTMTPTLSAYFLFFNPAVQGTARIIETMANPKVVATLGAGMLGIAALALRNAGMGDDDDGVAWWDKIPDEVKERNLVIVLPPGAKAGEPVKGSKIGRYAKIPMPYGYNFFAVVANQVVDAWRHSQDPKRGRGALAGAGKAFTAFMGAWVPVQELGRSLETPQAAVLAAVPDALNPVAQIAINLSSFGRPLYPDDRESKNAPDSSKYFPAQAGTLFQRSAQKMNEATGGDRYRSGLIDMTPAALESIVRGYGGGPAGFAIDLANAFYLRQSIERATPRYEALPFVKQLYGVIDAETDRMLGYQRLEEASKIVDPLKRAQHEGGPEARESVKKMREEYGPMLALGGTIEATRERLSALRKRELQIVGSPKAEATKYAELIALADKRRLVLQQFNAAFDRATVRQHEEKQRQAGP